MVDSFRGRLPFDLRLPIPQRRWISVEGALGDRLWICGCLHVDASVLGRALSTLLLAIFLLFEGVVKIVFYFKIRGATHRSRSHDAVIRVLRWSWQTD